MEILSPQTLVEKKCLPCEGGIEPCSLLAAQKQLALLAGWVLTADGKRIRKDWMLKNFLAGLNFFNEVARVAEEEQHHPDLHLEGYRHVWIEIWTHAINGLSVNDFILATKIDTLPIQGKVLAGAMR